MNFLPIKLLVNEKIIKETLNRIGIVNKIKMVIYPSCYLLKIENEYYIVHFKQIFRIINKEYYYDMSDEDIERRNAIVFCLKNWELIEVDNELIKNHNKYICIVPYSEKGKWKVSHKININKLRFCLV